MPRFANLVAKVSKDSEADAEEIDDEEPEEAESPLMLDLLDMGIDPSSTAATSNTNQFDITDALVAQEQPQDVSPGVPNILDLDLDFSPTPVVDTQVNA